MLKTKNKLLIHVLGIAQDIIHKTITLIFRSKSKIKINSLEYQCWHEVGHAVVCLHMGGIVNFIEIIGDNSLKGLARVNCVRQENIRPYVLCGGFATEYLLHKKGLLTTMDEREFTQLIFFNSTHDREGFLYLNEGDDITKEDDEYFMNYAIQKVVPIIEMYEDSMKDIVKELKSSKRIEGTRAEVLLSKYHKHDDQS